MFNLYFWCVFIFFATTLVISASQLPHSVKEVLVDCSTLRMGQYLCPDPTMNRTDYIDPNTQQIRGCTKDNKAKGI